MNEKKCLDKMANPSSPQVVSGDPSGAEADGDKGTSKNQAFFVRARKPRAENRSVWANT